MKYEIEDKLAQALLNYLAEQPYKEVVQLIQGLLSLKQIKAKEPDQTIEES